MTHTITRSYQTYDDARIAVEQLQAAGIADGDISVVGHQEDTKDSNAGEGAGIGGAIGGAAGLLAGLGLIAIPGIGPVVAAGWLAATAAGAVTGAAAGGLVGALTSAGISKEDADYHAETVRRGGTVVSVRTTEEHAPTVEAILDGATPIDRDSRLADYRADGWNRFDETAGPYRPPVV
ncbi:hypothetical protein DWF00_25145 [Bosea caraganae]|uniref:General stress protein 17M-like domain-containing protein n=1 Tax=Bosea caraganae TaxID=2763117 RepID=A0A370LAW6_9HYPH|nr:general stress protein [Bosea caraganae]RDJ21650.1 hypothetical protein DWF00_25145 [Bosea caraganae]RDJ28320.1 hypothetical protein DWE98_07010 [Bosea caraganae]